MRHLIFVLASAATICVAVWCGGQVHQDPIVLPVDPTVRSVAADLAALGWVNPEDAAGITEANLHHHCHEYCEFWGLEHDDDSRLAGVADHIAHRGCMVGDFEGMEEANWPRTCRDDLGLYIDWDRFNERVIGMSRSQAEGLFADALDHWNSKVGVNLYISDDLASAVCYVSWQNLGGSTLAWSHLADNSCSDDKKQRYDIRSWSPHQFYQTVIHECGHLIGLPHRRGNYVMNPTIITSLDGLTDRDVQDAKSLGYADPFEDPKPPTDGTSIAGSITLDDGVVIPASRIRRIDLTIGTDNGGNVIVLPPL